MATRLCHHSSSALPLLLIINSFTQLLNHHSYHWEYMPLHFNPTRDCTLTSFFLRQRRHKRRLENMHAIGSMSQQRHICDTKLGIIRRRSPPACGSRSDSYAQCCQAPILRQQQSYRIPSNRFPAFFLHPRSKYLHREADTTNDAVSLLPSSISPGSGACMNQDMLLTSKLLCLLKRHATSTCSKPAAGGLVRNCVA
jgi:hypothetical protein